MRSWKNPLAPLSVTFIEDITYRSPLRTSKWTKAWASESTVMAVEPILLGAVETVALPLPPSVESKLSTLCVSADEEESLEEV
jgi:hypothetical protein